MLLLILNRNSVIPLLFFFVFYPPPELPWGGGVFSFRAMATNWALRCRAPEQGRHAPSSGLQVATLRKGWRGRPTGRPYAGRDELGGWVREAGQGISGIASSPYLPVIRRVGYATSGLEVPPPGIGPECRISWPVLLRLVFPLPHHFDSQLSPLFSSQSPSTPPKGVTAFKKTIIKKTQ